MPKHFKNLGKVLAGQSDPLVMVFLSEAEVASHSTTLKLFSNGDDLSIITNLEKMNSPVDAAALSPLENASSTLLEGDDFNSLNELITMRCTACNRLAGVNEELAFALVGEDLNCPACSEEAHYIYCENASDDDDSDDSDDDSDNNLEDMSMSDDDSDDSSDEDDSDGDDDMSMSDDDDSDDESDDSDDDDDDITMLDDDSDDSDDSDDDSSNDDDDDTKVVDIASEDTGNDDNPFTSEGTELKALLDKYKAKATVVNGNGNAMSGSVVKVLNVNSVVFKNDGDGSTHTIQIESVSDEDGKMVIKGTNRTVEKASQTVYVAEMANFDRGVKIVDMSNDMSEVAVMVGGVHVGTIKRSEAAETATSLFTSGKALFQSFRPTLMKHKDDMENKELAAFGFSPAKFEVEFGELFNRRLQKEVAAAEAAAKETARKEIGNLHDTIALAVVGINRGVFQKDNDLASEIAKTLKVAGVRRADVVARNILATKSDSYFKAVLEQAKELASKSQDYREGVAKAIANAKYTTDESEEESKEIATAFIPSTPAKREAEISGFVGEQPKKMEQSGNKYANLVGSLGRNR